ncbi:hypothetical protein VL20_5445 [Microcystis panniformis FACHB-1757]|uniref:Uncharacterized protein n=1 Tax=Microcystis panniformis FACHB-1757 TaxID=1638788 RepID=A0A0K1S812_9CHRO|nr:hypothetical protein VL20_5445 [Microcystis panniformis FACHB-1757]
MLLPIEIPESERTPLLNWLLNLVAEQKQVGGDSVVVMAA